MRMVKQYRLVVWGRAKTPWRFDQELVYEAAVERGEASFDERYGHHFMNIGVRIQRREVPADQVLVRLDSARAA